VEKGGESNLNILSKRGTGKKNRKAYGKLRLALVCKNRSAKEKSKKNPAENRKNGGRPKKTLGSRKRVTEKKTLRRREP